MSTATLKKKRSPNWEDIEKVLLRQVLKEYLGIIENKNTDTYVNNEKKRAWLVIHERFNALNNRVRSLDELKQQWRTVKMSAKRNLSDHRRAVNATGGGPRPPSPAPEDIELADLLPLEFKVDSNEYDSDKFDCPLLFDRMNYLQVEEIDIPLIEIIDEIPFKEQENADCVKVHDDAVAETMLSTPKTLLATPMRCPKKSPACTRRKIKMNSQDIGEPANKRSDEMLVMFKKEHEWKKAKYVEEQEWKREEQEWKREEQEWKREEHALRKKKLLLELQLLEKNLNK